MRLKQSSQWISHFQAYEYEALHKMHPCARNPLKDAFPQAQNLELFGVLRQESLPTNACRPLSMEAI